MTNPTFEISLGSNGPLLLAAQQKLARISSEGTFHTANQLRLPFGIYNVSLFRICDKLVRLATLLELLFRSANDLDQNLPSSDLMQIIDYIELSIYAAAEHVDDIDSIATNFFPSVKERNKHPAYRDLDVAIKQHKKFVSSAANAIKHQQSRIRIVSTEYQQGSFKGLLHGYFIEGVRDGVICGHELFHASSGALSATHLIWKIIAFLLLCSAALESFLGAMTKEVVGPPRFHQDKLREVIRAAVRLPYYSFDDGPPVSQCTLAMLQPQEEDEPACSRLYGSLGRGWLRFAPFRVFRSTASFEGDGVSRQFSIPFGKHINLHHHNIRRHQQGV